jgi:APA family basic amino acid/polyamine antiporter
MESNSKKIGLFDATLLVSGSMIGSGIFIVTADMGRLLGNAYYVIFAWILTGLITLLAALSFGELASMMPTAGGQYNFISRIYGRVTGFVYGWSVFSVIQTGVIAAVAMAFAKYLGVFKPEWGPNSFLINWHITDNFSFKLNKVQLIAVSMIFFLSLINTMGVKEGKWIQRIFTIAKLVALFSIITAGLYLIFGGNINGVTNYFSSNFKDGLLASSFKSKMNTDDAFTLGNWEVLAGFGLLMAFSSAMVGSLFSSDAWQGITFMSNEIKNPVKNLPKALLFGTTLVTVVYVLANLAYLALLPLKGQDAHYTKILTHSTQNVVVENGISHAVEDRVGAAAATALMGFSNKKNDSSLDQSERNKLGLLIMSALIMISTFGCNNGLILAGSRLYKAMADNGLFFKSASKENKRGVPANALWMQAVWASLLCLTGTYGDLLNYCTFASLLFYIITVIGLIKLRIDEPNADRPYKVWGYPYLPLLYILLAGCVAIGILISQFTIAVNGIIIVLTGIPIYYVINRKKAL